jgi:hypothetical protein
MGLYLVEIEEINFEASVLLPIVPGPIMRMLSYRLLYLCRYYYYGYDSHTSCWVVTLCRNLLSISMCQIISEKNILRPTILPLTK